MTFNQFTTYTYRHSEVIVFHEKHPEVDVECMLLAVDFDRELFRLVSIDTELYEDESFWISYTHCDKPARKPKMKIIRGTKNKI